MNNHKQVFICDLKQTYLLCRCEKI